MLRLEIMFEAGAARIAAKDCGAPVSVSSFSASRKLQTKRLKALGTNAFKGSAFATRARVAIHRRTRAGNGNAFVINRAASRKQSTRNKHDRWKILQHAQRIYNELTLVAEVRNAQQ
jgi:hypothetical protein